MSVTLQLTDTDSIHLTDERIERRSPGHIEFAVAGTLSLTEAVLAAFEGATLNPAQATIAIDEGRTVDIDLTDEASLRLETIDVGIASPDPDDLVPESDPISAVADDDPASAAPSPDVLAFTVEGVIRGVSTEAIEAVAAGDPEFASLTFTVDDLEPTGDRNRTWSSNSRSSGTASSFAGTDGRRSGRAERVIARSERDRAEGRLLPGPVIRPSRSRPFAPRAAG
ncbi:hypothetical protein [Natronorubrum halalkaliphilum]|uniref:hypothetical protein n=1 Tax=Natronorubrum halalkaliphilum TaxID=2691917 RepID=UPI001F1D9FEC|nr:hypothetical protein [Natronorubrum halalkaliphilum]